MHCTELNYNCLTNKKYTMYTYMYISILAIKYIYDIKTFYFVSNMFVKFNLEECKLPK